MAYISVCVSNGSHIWAGNRRHISLQFSWRNGRSTRTFYGLKWDYNRTGFQHEFRPTDFIVWAITYVVKIEMKWFLSLNWIEEKDLPIYRRKCRQILTIRPPKVAIFVDLSVIYQILSTESCSGNKLDYIRQKGLIICPKIYELIIYNFHLGDFSKRSRILWLSEATKLDLLDLSNAEHRKVFRP